MWRHFIFIPLTAIAEPFMDSLLIDQENTTGGMSLWQMVTPGPLTWTIKTVSSRFMTATTPIPTEYPIYQTPQHPTPFPPAREPPPTAMNGPRPTMRPRLLTAATPPHTTAKPATPIPMCWPTTAAQRVLFPPFPSTKAGTLPLPFRFWVPTTTPVGPT